MHRRQFVQNLGYGIAASLVLRNVPAFAAGSAVQLTAQVNNISEGPADVWLPVPLDGTSYQRLLKTSWEGNFSFAEIVRDSVYGAAAFHARWDKGGKKEMQIVHRLQLSARSGAEPARPLERELYLKASEHIQTDGIVRSTAGKIVGAEKNDDRKALLIYDWIVENTVRDPKVRGCGTGDVKSLLASGNFKGKCADLNSLFVGLCRAAGVPAREVFGLRVLPSKLSKSLGKEGDVSKGQHCRAEYLSVAKGGWVPVDPADVRKVMLEENLALTNKHLRSVRGKLFGSWEPNWIAYNSARDFVLAPGGPAPLNYLMYPLLVSKAGELDGRDPEVFKYSLHSKRA